MGRFGSFEEVDDTLAEWNHNQTSFELVRINIRTVCFDFIADKQVFLFSDTLEIDNLAQIGPNMGPGC